MNGRGRRVRRAGGRGPEGMAPGAGSLGDGAGPPGGTRRWAPSVCQPKVGAPGAEVQSGVPGTPREIGDWGGSSEEPGPGGKAGGAVRLPPGVRTKSRREIVCSYFFSSYAARASGGQVLPGILEPEVL